jgi:flagellar biosynthesis protein FliR
MAPILFSSAEIVRFLIVLLRISGIMLLAPFFSSQTIPAAVRIAFALATSFVLAPSLPLQAVPEDLNLGNIVMVFPSEILFGILLGFAATCVFAGFQFAGQVVSFQLGFSLINVIDPQTQVESSVFSFLQNYLGLLFFLLINGHHWFLLAVNQSFALLPVGGAHFQATLMEYTIRLTGELLVIGLRIAGPVIAVSVITDVVMGVVGRTAPQINILIVGMPLKTLIGFGCLSFSFYFLPRYLEGVYATLHHTLFSIVHAVQG